MGKKRARDLKTFIKGHKRYRVVYTTSTKGRALKAIKMYDNKTTAIHHDKVKDRWLIGVRKV